MYKIVIAVFCVLLIIGVICVWRSYYERTHLTVTEYNIRNRKIQCQKDGISLVVLADLHSNRFGEHNEVLVKKIIDQKPDAILIAGDAIVVKNPKKKDFLPFEELLMGLENSGIPIWFCKGNHEQRMKANLGDKYPGWYAEFTRILEKYHVRYLENENYEWRDNIRIWSYDLPLECYKKRPEYKTINVEEGICEELGKPDAAEFNLLLAHSPLFGKEFAEWGADLTISGHFHGGTIRIPGFGGLMSPQFQFFSGVDRGCYPTEKEKYQITSGGLGTHTIDFRLNNMSEIVIIHLGGRDTSPEG